MSFVNSYRWSSLHKLIEISRHVAQINSLVHALCINIPRIITSSQSAPTTITNISSPTSTYFHFLQTCWICWNCKPQQVVKHKSAKIQINPGTTTRHLDTLRCCIQQQVVQVVTVTSSEFKSRKASSLIKTFNNVLAYQVGPRVQSTTAQKRDH